MFDKLPPGITKGHIYQRPKWFEVGGTLVMVAGVTHVEKVRSLGNERYGFTIGVAGVYSMPEFDTIKAAHQARADLVELIK